MNSTYGVVAVALVAIATLGIGAFGLRMSRTTSDFYVASRSVSPVWNSSAIGGEYLSAASFLGVLVYPGLFALGWVYIRQVERAERDFTELVEPHRPDNE